jgi:alkylhydroperoxidase family enzyme
VSRPDWEATGVFGERDAAAIRWADRVTRNEAAADAEAWAEVTRLFSWPEVVELTLATSLFAFLNRFNDTMWLELDGGAPPNANLFVEPEAFRRYAAGMYGDGGP